MQKIFLSEMLHRPVRDKSGKKLGHVHDIAVDVSQPSGPPPLCGIVLRHAFAPAAALVSLGSHHVVLDASQLTPWESPQRGQDELHLREDLLDRTFIRLTNPALCRANDVQLEEVGGWRAVGVDISGSALLRRFRLLSWWSGRPLMVPWGSLETFRCETRAPQSFVARHDQLCQSLACDIAQLLLPASYCQREEIFTSLDLHRQIEVVAALSPDMRLALMSVLDRDARVRLLDHMEAGLASTILKRMPPLRSSPLLGQLRRHQAELVAWLLSQPDNSAGATMRTDIILVPQTETVGSLLAMLRDHTLSGITDTIYITDRWNTRNLRGVLDLRRLLEADPRQRLEEIMESRLVVRRIEQPVDEVGRAMAHYNLTVMPILDKDNQLVGAVTLDGALEHFMPPAWLKRVPRVLS